MGDRLEERKDFTEGEERAFGRGGRAGDRSLTNLLPPLPLAPRRCQEEDPRGHSPRGGKPGWLAGWLARPGHCTC